jgi:hypothetical protein
MDTNSVKEISKNPLLDSMQYYGKIVRLVINDSEVSELLFTSQG